MGFHMAFSASFYSPQKGQWTCLLGSTRPKPLFKIHVLIVQIMKTMEPVLQAIVLGEVPSAYL
jgi:hypothetical protein